MAQGPESRQHHDTLDELNSLADHLRDWIAENPLPLLVGAGILLASAAGLGGWQAWRGKVEDRASAAYAAVERDYLKAMGAAPGSSEIVEPANPETGKSIRRDYSEKFLEVAAENGGTRAAWAARVSAGDLLLGAGETERAIEVWQEAIAKLPAADPGRGVVLQRIAAAHEAAGRWKDAGAAWLDAGNLPNYPLRNLALAEAARCFREAGDPGRAAEAARAIDPAALATGALPAHLQAIVAEVKAREPAAPATP